MMHPQKRCKNDMENASHFTSGLTPVLQNSNAQFGNAKILIAMVVFDISTLLII